MPQPHDDHDDAGTASLFGPDATTARREPAGPTSPDGGDRPGGTAEATRAMTGGPAPRAGTTTVPVAGLPHGLPGSTAPGADETAAAAGRPQPGQLLFGKYLVERQLGQGGMGTVWLVRHQTLNTFRALKMIVAGVAIDHHTRERFRREAQVMAAFSHHPNAVAVHDALITDDAAFIDMEYVQGQSIDKLLQPGQPMPLDWTARILVQLCDVLGEAHARGIVHRDLSPSNLMLLEGRPVGQEHLKVLDFGIAKILGTDSEAAVEDSETLTEAGGFIGKPPYASPEQIFGQAIDGRSDIYSVGVILYEILTGCRPFQGSRMQLFQQHWNSPPPPFAASNSDVHVPGEIERLVLRCLAKDPAERPQSAAELAEEFLQALSPGASSAAEQARVARLAPTAPAITAAGEETEPATIPMGKAVPHSGWDTLPAAVAPPTADRRAGRGRLVGLGVAGLVLGVLAVAIGFGSMRLGKAPTSDVKGPEVEWGGVSPGGDDRMARTLARWKLDGYEPSYEGGADHGEGWPVALVRQEDNVWFKPDRRGFYFPDGYRPEGAEVNPVDGWPQTLVRDDDVEFVRIAGGRFTMGNPDADLVGPGDPSVPAHEVRLSGFYIQKHEVTNREMKSFLREYGPDLEPTAFRKRDLMLEEELGRVEADRYPAVGIPYRLAETFARRHGGRLPTEAQWEFAARSRDKGYRYVWGNDDTEAAVRQVANIHSDVSDYGVDAVGRYPEDATEQGVMDLAGNAREWCRDLFRPYTRGAEPLRDPAFPPVTSTLPDVEVVVRGGSYRTTTEHRFTTFRDRERYKPAAGDDTSLSDVGFRLVIECPERAEAP